MAKYTAADIQVLEGLDAVRMRPGMYIGRLGDGQQPEDGIYVLLKEVIDNSIDEFKMNAGKRIEVDILDNLRASIRDYGRGIPQGKLVEAVSMLNTGGKYDSKAFKKSVGLNGVGLKAVNALSSHFEAHSYRDGQVRKTVFEKGILVSDTTEATQDENGIILLSAVQNSIHGGNDGFRAVSTLHQRRIKFRIDLETIWIFMEMSHEVTISGSVLG